MTGFAAVALTNCHQHQPNDGSGEVGHHLLAEGAQRLHHELVGHGAHLHHQDELVDAGLDEAVDGLPRRDRVSDDGGHLRGGLVSTSSRPTGRVPEK